MYHVNGELTPASEATVSVDDRGFRYGDAAFETCRAYGGRVFLLVLYAWSGLGAAIGPPLILSLWWKGTTKAGVIAGMITGAVVTIFWNQVMTPLFGFWFYELLVSFPVSFIVTLLVSSFTKPPETALAELDIMKKPLDEVIGAGDTSYRIKPSSIGLTEMDQVKAWLGNLKPQTMP